MEQKCNKFAICTNLPKIIFFCRNLRKDVKKLSTQKKSKNAIKPSFTQSYPHYPHKNVWIMWITFLKKRTNVLLRYNKNDYLSKKISKKLDF